jgi:hypothetical protein
MARSFAVARRLAAPAMARRLAAPAMVRSFAAPAGQLAAIVAR